MELGSDGGILHLGRFRIVDVELALLISTSAPDIDMYSLRVIDKLQCIKKISVLKSIQTMYMEEKAENIRESRPKEGG